MKFQGAVIKEQGATFAVVVVKKHILDSAIKSSEAIRVFRKHFPGLPITLMAQDSRGVPSYRGERDDIVKFLVRIPFQAIPWKEYTIH
jgi:hypothetical protein